MIKINLTKFLNYIIIIPYNYIFVQKILEEINEKIMFNAKRTKCTYPLGKF